MKSFYQRKIKAFFPEGNLIITVWVDHIEVKTKVLAYDGSLYNENEAPEVVKALRKIRGVIPNSIIIEGVLIDIRRDMELNISWEILIPKIVAVVQDHILIQQDPLLALFCTIHQN